MKQILVKTFDDVVRKKFEVFNSLFLNLPQKEVKNIGILLPTLIEHGTKFLSEGKDSIETLEAFFELHTHYKTEKEKINFMFKVIQYVERQVVLYDSVEDSGFEEIKTENTSQTLRNLLKPESLKLLPYSMEDKLNDFSTRIVFTAHPTQFYPPTVLSIMSTLKKLISKNDITNIDLLIKQLGLTSMMNLTKPSPLEEAKNIIFILRFNYYEGVSAVYENLKASTSDLEFNNPDILQLGFWPGGDRDGNPFVTAATTGFVAEELRTSLMKCYYHDLKKLRLRFTFPKTIELIEGLEEKVYQSMFTDQKLIHHDEILAITNQIKKLLITEYDSLFIDELMVFENKVQIFKSHFASLDIRQHHEIHEKTVTQILIKNGWIKHSITELEKNKLIEVLLTAKVEIDSQVYQDPLVKDTIENISQIKEIQMKNGELGCNRYIISNAEDEYSVLFVYALLRWCGWQQGNLPMDIIPLFESMNAMKEAPKIMDNLFNNTHYRAHLENRKNQQTVMLGFSDGTKDGGYLQANWSIFRCKENLSETCKQYGIKPLFFDGRGGPPARGGGRTQQFYSSLSDRIENNAIQLTIQGQTITSMYGTKEHFIHNCEKLITAGLSNFQKATKITEQHRDLLAKLAQISYEKYTSLKNHPNFISYLENKSTLKYYQEAKIGSRPTKRGNKEKLLLKDLRAIPFVGSWSQLKQNVPGYYGVGTAFEELIEQGHLEALQQLYQEVPFFKTLIQNSMMSLSKCNFNLTSYIRKDAVYGEFWENIHSEYQRSKKMTKLISQSEFLDEEPVTKESIKIRESIVFPLLIVQHYALQKIEQETEFKSAYEKIIKRSLYGNINASRNST